jgi:hypothetical protein
MLPSTILSPIISNKQETYNGWHLSTAVNNKEIYHTPTTKMLNEKQWLHWKDACHSPACPWTRKQRMSSKFEKGEKAFFNNHGAHDQDMDHLLDYVSPWYGAFTEPINAHVHLCRLHIVQTVSTKLYTKNKQICSLKLQPCSELMSSPCSNNCHDHIH